MWDVTDNVGPQSDGTYVIPETGLTVPPADAGGGAPASYSSSILDIFKWGVGVWQQGEQQKSMLDYRRWEATQAGLAQQGQTAAQYAVNQSSNTTLLLLGGAVLLVLLLKD